MAKVNDKKPARKLGGATFVARIQYRQNASWQGTIQWLDGKKTAPFRSALEMILLMHEALETNNSGDLPCKLNVWGN